MVVQISAIVLVGTAMIVPAEAHVLKEDNGITNVLHIPPEDNPIAGQNTELDFSFYDQKDAFSIEDCNCDVLMQSNGKTIQSTVVRPYAKGAELTGLADVRFPKIGIYNLVIKGSSKTNAFPNFQLIYLERVATSANGQSLPKSTNGSEPVLIGVASLVILGMVASSAIANGKRYKKLQPADPTVTGIIIKTKPKKSRKKTTRAARDSG
jgi:hypothetical protein